MDKNFQGNFNRTKQMLLQMPELQAKRRPKDFEAEASKANSRWLSNFWLSRFSDTSWYSIRSIWKTFGLTDIFGEKFSTKFSHTDNLARPYSPSEMVRTLWFIWFIIWTSYPIIRGLLISTDIIQGQTKASIEILKSIEAIRWSIFSVSETQSV